MKLYKILVVDSHRHSPTSVFEYTYVTANSDERAVELSMEYWKDITLAMLVEKSWDLENLNNELVLV